MKNVAFGIVYLVQAILVYNWPDAEVLNAEKMFIAMFTLMFGLFAFIQAMTMVADKDKAIECARKMFYMIETPSVIDPLARSQEYIKRI